MMDEFDNLMQARKAYRRCRRRQEFILSDNYIEKHDPVCAHCGKKFSEHSKVANEWAEKDSGLQFDLSRHDLMANISAFDPRTKKVAIMRYDCAWSSLLNDVFEPGRKLY